MSNFAFVENGMQFEFIYACIFIFTRKITVIHLFHYVIMDLKF